MLAFYNYVAYAIVSQGTLYGPQRWPYDNLYNKCDKVTHMNVGRHDFPLDMISQLFDPVTTIQDSPRIYYGGGPFMYIYFAVCYRMT